MSLFGGHLNLSPEGLRGRLGVIRPLGQGLSSDVVPHVLLARLLPHGVGLGWAEPGSVLQWFVSFQGKVTALVS